tara:strand:- start:251 stop:394 length:144 start_codon:yes stop_codon:yes gene_type:complete
MTQFPENTASKTIKNNGLINAKIKDTKLVNDNSFIIKNHFGGFACGS